MLRAGPDADRVLQQQQQDPGTAARPDCDVDHRLDLQPQLLGVAVEEAVSTIRVDFKGCEQACCNRPPEPRNAVNTEGVQRVRRT